VIEAGRDDGPAGHNPNGKEHQMRYMLFMKPNITEETYAAGPSPETVAAMSRYNEELTKAGVLLALDGLHPTSEGARVRFSGGRPTVTDGPFTEAKELIGGYWLIQARSKDEAVQWASRCPAGDGDEIEVRRVYEMTDHTAEVQAAAGELSATPPEQTVAS
jgi:hypothetical protein